MNQGLIPRRYAKALYKFAIERGVADALYGVMGNMVKAFLAEPGLNKAMSNPFVKDSDKESLLRTAAGIGQKADKDDKALADVFEDFILLLRRNNRMPQARDIAVAYRDIYRAANHIYRVTVTSAAPMDAEARARLEGLIAKHLPANAKTEYKSLVNPDLIGGFTVAIDNDMLDASVAGELDDLRRRLLTKS